MNVTKLKVECFFESLTNLIIKNSLIVLLVIIIPIVGVIVTQMPKLKVDTSVEGLLLESDEALIEYAKFKNQFGRDDLIVIGIESDQIFTIPFLEKLKALHEDIESLQNVDEVNSLLNARYSWGDQNQLIIEDLLENWPDNETDLESIKAKALSNPLYQNLLITPDLDFTVLSVKLDTFMPIETVDDEFSFDLNNLDFNLNESVEEEYLSQDLVDEAVNELEKIVENYHGDNFQLFLSGSPVYGKVIKANIRKDLGVLTLLCVVLIALLLALLFRRLSAVVLPVLVMLLSLFMSLSLLALCGVPIKAPTTILPNFIIVVSICASIHVLMDFYRDYDKSGDKKAAIVRAVSSTGFPIFLTSLTTAASVFSFCFVKVSPIVDVGIFGASSILISLILNLLLIPVLLSIFPIKKRVLKANCLDRRLGAIGEFAVDNSKSILSISLVLAVAALFFATKIVFSHNTIVWLKKDVDARVAVEKIDKKMSGSVVLEIVLDTGKENGVYSPSFLNGLEEFSKVLETDEEKFGLIAGQTVSIVDVLKESHKALNSNQDQYYKVPKDKSAITDELFLFELGEPDDLIKVVDSQFRYARLTVKVPVVDAVSYMHFIDAAFEQSQSSFGDDVTLVATGYISLMAKVMSAIIYSMQFSYTLSFLAVALLMVVLLGNIKLGLLSMVPNFLPILLALGVCGLFAIPMDSFLIMVGSVALGLAVDDTIHYMWSIKKHIKLGWTVKASVDITMKTVGRAMLCTTIILTLGFLAYAFSSLNNLVAFGLLLGLSILLALLSDFLLVPALLSRQFSKIDNNLVKTKD